MSGSFRVRVPLYSNFRAPNIFREQESPLDGPVPIMGLLQRIRDSSHLPRVQPGLKIFEYNGLCGRICRPTKAQ